MFRLLPFLIMLGLFLAVITPALAQEPVTTCSSGDVFRWKPTTPLLTPRLAAAAVSNGQYLYAIGGQALVSVEYAAILTDGTLGPWQETASLSQVRVGGSTAISGTLIYLFDYSGGVASNVEYAEFLPDGSLTPWAITTTTNLVPQPIESNGYKYRVEYAQVDRVGLVERAEIGTTSWEPVNMTDPKGAAGVAAGGNYLYVIGGIGLAVVEYWDTRLPVWPSDYGITINDGQLFTNQISVTLTTGQPPMWLDKFQVSNDGGFAGSSWQTFQFCKPWTITQYGSSIIPRTVYVRFKDKLGQLSPTFSDDIILDITAPEGSLTIGALQTIGIETVEEIEAQAGYIYYLPLIFKHTPVPNVTLHLSAWDDISGVGFMLISNQADFTGNIWEPYTPVKNWRIPKNGRVYVKFKDFAGNASVVYSARR